MIWYDVMLMILKNVTELLRALVSWPATSRVTFATKKLKKNSMHTVSDFDYYWLLIKQIIIITFIYSLREAPIVCITGGGGRIMDICFLGFGLTKLRVLSLFSNWNVLLRLLAQTTLRNILGTKNLHEILSDRESIAGSMQVNIPISFILWFIIKIIFHFDIIKNQ